MMDRRIFIKISWVGIGSLALPLLNGCSSEASEHDFTIPVFLSHIFDRETLASIGKSYRQMIHDESDKNKLMTKLLENSGLHNTSPSKTVRKYFADLIREDFEKGRTIIVEGWILSVTEARQCALFSLLEH
jgi:hypothetical protein